MVIVPGDRRDLLGNFHNEIVAAIDKIQLNNMEVITVLELIVIRLKQLLLIELSAKVKE